MTREEVLGLQWVNLYDERRRLLDEVAVITQEMERLEQELLPLAGGVS